MLFVVKQGTKTATIWMWPRDEGITTEFRDLVKENYHDEH